MSMLIEYKVDNTTSLVLLEAQKEKGMWCNHPCEDAASVDFVPDNIMHKRWKIEQQCY